MQCWTLASQGAPQRRAIGTSNISHLFKELRSVRSSFQLAGGIPTIPLPGRHISHANSGIKVPYIILYYLYLGILTGQRPETLFLSYCSRQDTNASLNKAFTPTLASTYNPHLRSVPHHLHLPPPYLVYPSPDAVQLKVFYAARPPQPSCIHTTSTLVSHLTSEASLIISIFLLRAASIPRLMPSSSRSLLYCSAASSLVHLCRILY